MLQLLYKAIITYLLIIMQAKNQLNYLNRGRTPRKTADQSIQLLQTLYTDMVFVLCPGLMVMLRVFSQVHAEPDGTLGVPG